MTDVSRSTTIRRAWFTVLAGACSLVCAALAPAEPADEVGSIRVTVSGEHTDIAVVLPLRSLLGFAHPATTPEEERRVRVMAEQWRAAKLFTPSPQARCELSSVALSSPLLTPPQLGYPSARACERPPANAPAELRAYIGFRCRDASAVHSLKVNFADTFRGPKRWRAEVAAGGKHKRYTSNTAAFMLRW
jgi:hypothetical protein